MAQQETDVGSSPLQKCWVAIVFLLGIVLLVPWQVELFDATLDGSWRIVANEAFVARLQSGSEIVFTVGPYGFLYWSVYHPETYRLVLASWTVFALVYLGAVWRLGIGLRLPFYVRLGWLVGALILGAVDRDNTVLNGIIILALIHYFYAVDRSTSLFGLVLMFVVGWVGLIKFTFFVLSALVVAVVAMDQVIFRRRVPWGVAVFLVSLTVCWLLAGQSLSGFPRFISNSLEISSGYVDAMSVSSGLKMELLQFLGIAAFLFLLVAEASWRRWRWQSALPLTALCGIIYILFKHGFVRHDQHPIIASLGLVFLTVCYGLATGADLQGNGRRFAMAGLFTGALMLSAETLTRHTEKGLAATAVEKCVRALPAQTKAFLQALSEKSQLKQAHAARLAEIRQANPLPEIEGGVDLYPFKQGVLMAHGLEYSPRPVFQSYSAYTAPLAKLNLNHLRSPSRPGTVLFDIETIDQRFPAQDDGLSWPDLLTAYDLAEVAQTFLVLTNNPSPRTVSLAILSTVKANLGEPIDVPAVKDAPIWVVIDIRPTLYGRLQAFLIKPPALYLDVKTLDGVEREYRLIPRMAGAGFLLSPVIANRDDFLGLMTSDGLRGLQKAGVETIQVRTVGGRWNSFEKRCYQPDISVSFHQLQISKPASPDAQ